MQIGYSLAVRERIVCFQGGGERGQIYTLLANIAIATGVKNQN